MAYKPRVGSVMSEPNVIPMADIMLVLLIIFMVVTPMLQKGVSVDMAKVTNPVEMQDANRDTALVIAITRDGNYFLGTKQIALESITETIRDEIASGREKIVYVRSDARAKYGAVVKAVDEVRAAGVEDLALLTEKMETRRPSAAPARAGGN